MTATPRPQPDATDVDRIPAFDLMQRVMDAVPELARYRFEGHRVIFTLRQPLTLDGRECDDIAIRDVSEHAWMRVTDIDWAVDVLRGIIDTARPPTAADSGR